MEDEVLEVEEAFAYDHVKGTPLTAYKVGDRLRLTMPNGQLRYATVIENTRADGTVSRAMRFIRDPTKLPTTALTTKKPKSAASGCKGRDEAACRVFAGKGCTWVVPKKGRPHCRGIGKAGKSVPKPERKQPAVPSKAPKVFTAKLAEQLLPGASHLCGQLQTESVCKQQPYCRWQGGQLQQCVRKAFTSTRAEDAETAAKVASEYLAAVQIQRLMRGQHARQQQKQQK